MSANDFAICVHNNDIATLVKLPGVGKKTAERLLIEMRDKIGDVDATAAGAAAGTRNGTPDISQEAESALIALGYKPTDAAKIISRVANESVSDAGQLIRLALKSMGS
jgi:Holliday junction DNA helicase RuvA